MGHARHQSQRGALRYQVIVFPNLWDAPIFYVKFILAGEALDRESGSQYGIGAAALWPGRLAVDLWWVGWCGTPMSSFKLQRRDRWNGK